MRLLICIVIFDHIRSAIITYKGISAARPTLKIIHLILHLIALFGGILGICAVFKFHNELKFGHAYSLHSWIGLATISLFCLQVNFLYSNIPYIQYFLPTCSHLTNKNFTNASCY